MRARIESERLLERRQGWVPLALPAFDRRDHPQELAVVRLPLAGRAELLQRPVVIEMPPVVEVPSGDAGLREVGAEREGAIRGVAGQLELPAGAAEEVVEHAAGLC